MYVHDMCRACLSEQEKRDLHIAVVSLLLPFTLIVHLLVFYVLLYFAITLTYVRTYVRMYVYALVVSYTYIFCYLAIIQLQPRPSATSQVLRAC